MNDVDLRPARTTDPRWRSAVRSPVERLLRRARPDRSRRLTGRELRVEVASASCFLAVALSLPLLFGTQREFDPLLAGALVASHAVAARIRVFVGAGAAMPTQLIILPMLFLMPVTVVPALVAAGLLLAAAFDVVRGRTSAERMITATGDAWHAVGSSLVLTIAGEPGLVDAGWAILIGAIGAQCAADLVSATAREWLGRGIAPALQLRVVGSVHLIDVCLTPVGLTAAWLGTQHRLGFAVVVPLLALLGAFASDRVARIEEVARSLEDLRDERHRLDEAIRRIGDAFASKLDRVALVELAVQTAVVALGARYGRASLADRSIEVGERSEGVVAVLAAATAEPSHEDVLRAASDGETFALACPLVTCRDAESPEILAVTRAERDFTEPERRLFEHLVAQARIAIENVELHEMLRMQATTDELTGLANHRRFQETLTEEARRARRTGSAVALVMFDIDNFKAVNDVHGHQQGDAVLREVANAIARTARDTDKVARYGGEELAVVLPDTDLDGAVIAAEAMRCAVESLALPLPDGETLNITVSAGVSAMQPQLHEPGQLVAAADEALYEAKRSGKNRTVRGRRPEGRFLAGPVGARRPDLSSRTRAL